MLHANDLTYRIGDRLILDRASFNLPTSSRVGLVGRNGAGKTTLFRIVLGEISSESGGISLPRNTKIGAVAQEAPGGPETLIQVVLAADTERTRLLAEAETADFASRLTGLPPVEQERVVLDHVREAIARVLGHAGAEEIEANRPFKEIGFDSLTAVELRNRLRAATGLKLPATLVFGYAQRHLQSGLTAGATKS